MKNPRPLDRRGLFGAAAAAAATLWTVSAAEPKEEPKADSKEEKADDDFLNKPVPTPDWDLLRFFAGRTLREVRVELIGRKTEDATINFVGKDSYDGYNPSPDDLKGVVDDPKRLELLSSCLSVPIVRASRPGQRWGGTGKELRVGSAVFICDKKGGRPGERDEVKVLLTTIGAMLDVEPLSVTHVFYSWAFAKVLDDLVFEKTNARLPKRTFRTLSGEGWIDSHKELFEHFVNGKPLP